MVKLFPGETNFEEKFYIFLHKTFQFRFILDNGQYVTNKTVLDIGSGSAACSIASALAGASQVTANDIDPGADRFFFKITIYIFLCNLFQ